VVAIPANLLSIADEQRLRDAALRLQVEACRLTRSAHAMLVTYDWQRHTAWTVEGPVASIVVRDLVAQVAGSGRRQVLATSLVEPIGGAPAKAVLCLRRPPGQRFTDDDVALVTALVAALAAPLARLIAHP
jgi:hypothetical protein